MDFFELLRYSIGSQQEIVGTPSEEEWEFIHEIAKKQALTGLLYIGIKKLPKEMRIKIEEIVVEMVCEK